MTGSSDPSDAFDELGRTILSETSMEEMLQRVVELAKRTIPGVGEASISLVSRDRATTVTSTGQLARDLDETQYERGFGPCLDAATGGEVAYVADTAAEARWPDYTEVARRKGVGTSLSTPIPLQQYVTAALNLYGTEPGTFDGDSRATAASFAAYAGVALANMHLYDSTRALAEQMQAAMDSRAVVEQAKGVLMGQRRVSADDAFDLLVELGQSSSRTLRDVARAVVASAEGLADPA